MTTSKPTNPPEVSIDLGPETASKTTRRNGAHPRRHLSNGQ